MRSIRARIALAVSLTVLAVGAMAYVATDQVYRLILDSVASETVVDGQRGFEALRVSRADRTALAIDVLSQDREVRSAFSKRDRARLLEVTYPRFERLRDEFGITRLYFYEPGHDGIIFLRTYMGEKALEASGFGDPSNSKVLVETRETAKTSSGLELGRSALSLRVISPFLDDEGHVAGYVGMAEQVHDYLEAISARTGDDYALFLSKQQLDRAAWTEVENDLGHPVRWDQHADVVLADTTLPSWQAAEDFDANAFVDKPKHLGFSTREGSVYSIGVFPLKETDGSVVGQVFALRDLTSLVSTLRRAQMGIVMTFLVLAIVAAAVSVLIAEKMVFGRIDAMIARMEQMSLSAAAGGSHGTAIEPVADDEFGRFERFFAQFMARVALALELRDSNKREP